MLRECECAAGMGPTSHCKHTVAVLLALLDFTLHNVVLLELSCTDTLQTFHQPRRKRVGSPIKACNLKVHGCDSATLIYDPRPSKYHSMPGYPDYVKNLTVNYAATHQSNIPLLQTVPPVNMYATANDHDYFSKTPAELFLDTRNVTTITPEEADQLEEATVKQRECTLWKEERQKRLPSSLFGRIVKAKSDGAKQNIAKDIINGSSIPRSRQIAHGISNEAKARSAYEAKYGLKVTPCGIVVSPEWPYLPCSPDGLVGEDITLEIKCPYTAKEQEVNPHTVPYIKENCVHQYELDPKHDYYHQVQAHMMLTERSMAHFVVYTNKEVKKINVPYDPPFAENMRKQLSSFFENVFKPMYLKKMFFLDKI